MGKNEKTPITINDKEYFIEDLTDEQKILFNHVADLDRKIGNAAFNMDQLKVGRVAFADRLVASVEAPAETEVVDEEEAA